MTNNQRRLIPPILLIASTLASVLAFTVGYNTETGYLIKSPTTVALYAIVIAGIIVAVWCAFSIKKDHSVKFNDKIYVPASFSARLITVICAMMASGAIYESKYAIGATVISVMRILFFGSALISLLTHPAVWSKSKNKNALDLLSGYATVLLCLSSIALLYFDVSVEMNNPQKILIQLSLTSICLCELGKTRETIYKNGVKLHVFARYAALIFSPAAVVAALTAHFSGEKSFSHFYLFTALILGVYAIFDAIALTFSSVERSKDESDLINADGDEV